MKVNQDKVPSTIEEAVDMLVNSLSDEDKKIVSEGEDVNYHFGAGMHIRNSWSLWERDTPIKLDAVKNYKIAHADDLSGLIFEWAFSKVKNVPFDPLEHCKIYYEHWQKYCNMSALEAGGY